MNRSTVLLLILLVAPQAATIFSATIRVPGQRPTIQDGIVFAGPGDTVLVAGGTYTGEGNRDIDFGGKAITLKSENAAELTIIDCQGTESDPHRGFHFRSFEDSDAVVDGFTITGGYSPLDGPGGRRTGGAIFCDSASSPTIRNCIMHHNAAWDGGSVCSYKSSPTFINCSMTDNLPPYNAGGAVACFEASPVFMQCEFARDSALTGGAFLCRPGSNPTIIDCLFANNEARHGGAMFFDESTATIRHTTFRGNKAWHGGVANHGTPVFEHCIMHDNVATETGGCLRECAAVLNNCTIFRNTSPVAILYREAMTINNCIIAYNQGSPPTEAWGTSFFCTNIYGNSYGNWMNYSEEYANINGNVSIDPVFCDTANLEFGLWFTSPCLPESTMCGLMGAMDRGCEGHALPVAGLITYNDGAPDYAVRTLMPKINWIYTDTTETTQTAYELEVGEDSDWSVAEMWSTGLVYSSDTAVIYDGRPLSDKKTYHVRIRLRNETTIGGWAEAKLFVRLRPDNAGPSDWATFQYNEQHTGYNERDGITVPLELAWSKNYQYKPIHQPTVVGDRLIFTTRFVDDPTPILIQIQCVDATNGDYHWHHEYCPDFCAWDLSQANYAYGMVYFQITKNQTCHIRVCELETGVTIWDEWYWTQGFPSHIPAVNEGMVVIEEGIYGGISCYHALTGEQQWWTRYGGGGTKNHEWVALIHHDTAYTYIGGNLAARRLDTGETLTYFSSDGLDSHAQRTSPVLDSTRQILYCVGAKQLSAFDLRNQRFLWRKDGYWGHKEHFDFTGYNPVLYDSTVICVDSIDLVAFGALSGEEMWRIQRYPIDYRPVAANGLVFVGCDSVTMAVDIESHEIVWTCDVGGEMAIANNSLYIATRDGSIYCYGPVPTAVDDETIAELPTTYFLNQNYPNPFNPSTEISFTLPQASDVTLNIYNILGQKVATLVNRTLPPGEHTVTWNAGNKSSGIYLYRLQTEDFVDTKKMVLVK